MRTIPIASTKLGFAGACSASVEYSCQERPETADPLAHVVREIYEGVTPEMPRVSYREFTDGNTAWAHWLAIAHAITPEQRKKPHAVDYFGPSAVRTSP